MRVVTNAEELKEASFDTWDAVLLDVDLGDGRKRDLNEKVKLMMRNVPVLDLAGGSAEMVTLGAASALEDYFPKITVSTISLLRGVSNVLQHHRLTRQLEELRAKMAEIDRTDALTKLWNRSYVLERVHEAFQDWQRYRYPLTLCLFEIIDMDQVNEVYGYEIGEQVIATFGKLVRDVKRGTDYAGRLGTERFCIAFPSTPIQSALIGVERVRDAVQRAVFTGKSKDNFTVGVAFGVVQLGDGHAHLEDLMTAAKKALASAKTFGPGHIEAELPTEPA